jgi:toxin ParE1/3/4
VDAIKAEFDPLLQFPLMGPQREQFGANLRVVFHSHYAIYYLPAGRELIIVRVLHGARDAIAIAEQGGFKP